VLEMCKMQIESRKCDITVFCGVTLHSSVDIYHCFPKIYCFQTEGEDLFYPEDRNSRFLKNVDIYLPNHMVPYSRHSCSSTLT